MKWGCGCSCCQPCATSQWVDDFSSLLPGYTSDSCGGVAPIWATDGDIISVQNNTPIASGTYIRSVTKPADLQCVFVSTKLRAPLSKVAGTWGIVIAGVRLFSRRISASPPFVSGGADSNGCGTGVGTTFYDEPLNLEVPANEISGQISIRCKAAGGGLFDIEYCSNGKKVGEELGVSLTFPDPLRIGLHCTNGGGWTDLRISTN